jgi:hypothetical protein
MDDFEKAKLKAGLLKECDRELNEARLIINKQEREKVENEIHDRYQFALQKLGISSWKSLIDFKSNINKDDE